MLFFIVRRGFKRTILNAAIDTMGRSIDKNKQRYGMLNQANYQ